MIKRIEIEGEEIFLKKDWTGYRTVSPLVHPETKVFIWKNLFNKKGFLSLAYLCFLLLVLYLAFHEQLTNYQEVTSNPCKYCYESLDRLYSNISNLTKYDNFLTELNITNLTYGT